MIHSFKKEEDAYTSSTAEKNTVAKRKELLKPINKVNKIQNDKEIFKFFAPLKLQYFGSATWLSCN